VAASRARSVYSCGACGHEAPRWLGRCPGCGAWGSLSEEPVAAQAAARPIGAVPVPVRLAEVDASADHRLPTGIGELDRVLGGGLVPGSLVLLGGEPGIGKSTLVLQALARLSAGRRVMLITGEESAAQVKSRAARLGPGCDRIEVLPETRLEAVVAALEAHRPVVCAIDSVQTLVSEAADSGPGSVGQVRLAVAELMRVAKGRDIAMILVGQVTKDGSLAGPRLLEHLVDCVIAFEGDDLRAHRILRATKNRFGSTNETGVLEMRSDGLVSVDDPADLYLAEAGERVGSCLFPAVEGSRGTLVEVQALVAPTEIVPPRRVAGGIDRTRLAQVLAVLARHGGVRLGDQDVFVSIAGGGRAIDPAADLAIALALVSADRGQPLPERTCALGEVGLTGAVRPVGHLPRRLAAAAARGVGRALVPDAPGADPAGPRPGRMEAVGDLREAIRTAFRPPGDGG
jgi:DNA repair protein RadA/Sms